MAKAIHRDNISITCSLMPNSRVDKEVVEISKMQMYQGIAKAVYISFSVRVYADSVQECSNKSGNLCFNPASTPKSC